MSQSLVHEKFWEIYSTKPHPTPSLLSMITTKLFNETHSYYYPVKVGVLSNNSNIECYFKQHTLEIWTVSHIFRTAHSVL